MNKLYLEFLMTMTEEVEAVYSQVRHNIADLQEAFGDERGSNFDLAVDNIYDEQEQDLEDIAYYMMARGSDPFDIERITGIEI